MTIYELYYSHYDEYTPYYFWSQRCLSTDDWKSLCDSLIGPAIDSALAAAKGKTFSKVGWNDIVQAMAGMLEQKGFTPLYPLKCGYSGPSIIKRRKDDENEVLGNRVRDVIAHNRAAEELMNEHRLSEYDTP